MDVEILPAGPLQTNSYLIINKTLNQAVAVDAGPEAWDIFSSEAEKRNLEMKGLLITHAHWDHILDIYRFNEAGIPVYAHQDAVSSIEHPEQQSSMAFPGTEFKKGKVDHLLSHDESFELGGMHFTVRATPVHCPGSLVFYLDDGGCCFTGDLIFDGSIGRTDLPGGDMDQLCASIRNQIYTLPEETVLYPGHGSTTLVGKEKISNPFVSA